MLTENRSKCLNPNAELLYDEACLDILNTLNETVTLFGQYDECEGCNFTKITSILARQNTSVLINSQYSLSLNYTVKSTGNLCRIDQLFYEHYRYGWNLTEACNNLIYIKEPADSAYIPILGAFIVFFVFGTLWYAVKGVYKCLKNNETVKRFISRNTELENDLGTPIAGTSLVIERPPTIRKHPHRVKSIDVFRGFCIILMIFVNYGGGHYWFFNHSIWNGLTIADLVFPWFLWIMGVSFTISLNNKLRKALPRRELYAQVVRRSLLLVFLGLVLNSHGKTTPLTTLRLPGVLQRLGLCYLIVGIIETTFAKRTISINAYGRLAVFQDIIIALPQWVIMCILILVHTLVTFLLDVPGCGKGYLGPGGLSDLGNYYNCTGGAAGYIDRKIFGQHMYSKPTCHILYETKVNYDPEGLLGVLTSVVLMYLGVQAGRILHTYSNVKTRMLRWAAWGTVMCLIGGLLCDFSKNGGVIPINKNLWSLSFVLVLGGLAFFIEAFLFLIVDILRKWGGRPFFYPGMNSLFLYIGHILLNKTFPFAWTPVYMTHAAYLSMNLWGTALWVVISIWMYKQNIFFSI